MHYTISWNVGLSDLPLLVQPSGETCSLDPESTYSW